MGTACSLLHRQARSAGEDDLPARQVVLSSRCDSRARYTNTASPTQLAGDPTPSSISVSEKPPSQRNFPLPRELRDYMYGYLLDADEVVSTPYNERLYVQTGTAPSTSEANKRSSSTAHTYRFCTNILAVNKQIHAEAMEFLLGANTFMQVSHRWPGLGSLKHEYDVPIVTENMERIMRSKVVSLHYSIQHPNAEAVCSAEQCFVMLVRDFPSFVRMMRWLYFQTRVDVTLIVRRDTDGVLVDRACSGDFRTGAQVQLAPTLRRHQREAHLISATADVLTEQLLMVMPGQTFTLLGLAAESSQLRARELAETVTAAVGMRRVRVEALLWSIVHAAVQLKQAADALVLQGRYTQAADRFTQIGTARVHWVFMRDVSVVLNSNDATRSAFRVLFQILLDCTATASHLHFHLREGDIGLHKAALAASMTTLLSTIPKDPAVWPQPTIITTNNNNNNTTTTTTTTSHRHTIHAVLVTALILIKDRACLRAASLAMNVFRIMSETDHPHLDADIAFVRGILDDEKVSRALLHPERRDECVTAFDSDIQQELERYEQSMTEAEILGRLSITTAPVRVFDSHIPPAVLDQMSANMIGW